jgi:hypothetical protein
MQKVLRGRKLNAESEDRAELTLRISAAEERDAELIQVEAL